MINRIAIAAGVAALGMASLATAADLRVTRITPSGTDVRAERQITISFDRAMVPLGRMERDASEVPASVSPDPGCQWRWLDPQVLACNLPPETDLRPATAYTVSVQPPAAAIDGSALRNAQTHRFVTELPRLDYVTVVAWRGPAQPELQLRFNQPVTAASVERSVRFGGVVEVGADLFDSTTPLYTPDGEARTLWRAWPRETLQANRAYPLSLDAGLASAFGTEPGTKLATEQRFQTFPELQWLGIACQVGNKERRFTPGTPAQGCGPLDGIELVFSAPVGVAALREHLKLSPSPQLPSDPDFDPWANVGDDRPVAWRHTADRTYRVRLPFTFAAETQYELTLEAGLEDRFGRRLEQAASAQLTTGARRPRLVFEHRNSVLESGIDSEVPVIATNLQSIVTQYTRMDARGLEAELEHRVPVTPLRNMAFAMPLDVRGMMSGASGAVRGELRTDPATERPRPFFAQVTPWQVQVKLGHANTLVWVTRLDDGAPVSDAEVAIIEGFGETTRANGRTDQDGVAWLPGSAELDPKLEYAWRSGSEALAVRVRRGDDFALLPLEYDFVVDTWRTSREQISAWRRDQHGHLRSWGTTAQGVYRAGDTVQYKVYVRDDAGRSLSAAPAGDYALTVYDPTGTAVHERKDIKLSRFGAIDGEFRIAKTAAVGWYRFELKLNEDDANFEPLRVLVADFVPAPFRVSSELRADVIVPGQTVDVSVRATLHGGGPFSGARVRALARIEAAPLTPSHPATRGFNFDSVAPDARELQPLLDVNARLTADGDWQAPLQAGDGSVRYGRVVFEGSVEDDRGRSIAGRGSRPYHGRDRYVGVYFSDWMLQQGKAAALEALVIDAGGEPQAGSPYYIKIERKHTQGARVKGAGNAYITRYTHEWQRVETCKGRSTREAMRCEFVPDAAGEYRVTAMVRDTQDRLHETRQWIYAQGRGAVLWEDRPDYSLELRADRDNWRVGETARYFVKNPYPGARALITVERYGVLYHRVQTLDGSTPVIEIPVQADFVPGAYVSVVLMSPRAQTPPKEGVDLGKPAFRMGYATLKVDEPYRAIDVTVKPAREQYRPRETVELSLAAQPRNTSSEPIEFAVAVLDEAVFDLIQGGADYFDPLKGFTQLDALDLANYSLLMRLVGRQKFEKKGANPGGDGGADLSLRSIERFVAYWNPSLPADAAGKATFSFELPDQLTGWRVIALAVTPGDRMGLGQGGVNVSKPTELRPAMPNQLAVGDRFDAGFSVLNRAEQTRKLEVTIKVDGGATGEQKQTVELKPFERRVLSVPLTVERALPLRFEVVAGDSSDRDALGHVVDVRTPRSNATAADLASLTANAPLRQNLQVPADAREAQLEMQWSPTLIGTLDGVFAQMRDYPYTCWEQRLSRAVMAAHRVALQGEATAKAEWSDVTEVPAQTLADAGAFQAPGGGMAFFVPNDAYVSPYLSAFTGLAFGWLQSLGHAPPPDVWNRLDEYLLQQLREDPKATGYDSREARAQFRAIALAALAPRGKVDAAELARHVVQLPRMGLFGESLFLQAARQIKGADAEANAARDRMLARANESAARLSLQDDADGAWAWLLGSSLRSNCAALTGLVGERAVPGIAELPLKLVRHVTAAQGTRTHWANTQENLFCTRALIDYAKAFESEPVNLQINATLDDAALGAVTVTPESTPVLQRELAAGGEHAVDVTAQGQGRAYLSTRLRYREPDNAPAVSAGLTVKRSYAVLRDGQWQALETPLRLRRGELLKSELNVDIPAWMTYVVVDDPVPGGIEPLNPDLATTAGIDLDALGAGGAYPWPFYHRELRFEAVRHYADYVPQGGYRLVWVGQAVAVGEFSVERVHAEQMYDPDVFANGTGARLIVEEASP